MTLFSEILDLEENGELHLGRILVLLNAFSEFDNEGIGGITKLAKLDFLLRYPAFLERALEAKGVSSGEVRVRDYERISIESRMVRYRYGPWDFRYRKLLNSLVGLGLVKLSVEGKTVNILLTQKGRMISAEIAESKPFHILAMRSSLLKKNFDLGGTKLKNFIYETFPDIITLRYGEEITNEL